VPFVTQFRGVFDDETLASLQDVFDEIAMMLSIEGIPFQKVELIKRILRGHHAGGEFKRIKQGILNNWRNESAAHVSSLP